MPMDARALIETRARAAREAARALALCPTKTKNDALMQMARGLVEKTETLLEANRGDVERARGRVARAFLDRLMLTEARIEEMAAVLARALEKVGAPADAVQHVDTTDRAAVAALLELDRLVDLIIPRGGEEFVRWVSERSRVPVLKHDKGLVHAYVDADADVG